MASGPTAKRLRRLMDAAIDEADVRDDPAKAFETAVAVGRAFLRAKDQR
jgi:hypothetical protein